MKSLAQTLLETTLKEDDMAPPAAEPAAAAPAAAGEPPAAGAMPPAFKEAVDAMCDPDHMGHMLDAMGKKMESFTNEADDSTYTAKDMADKEDLDMAKGMMAEAATKLYKKMMIKK